MSPDYRETILSFDCCGDPLHGVLATPAGGPVAPVGLMIVVGGPQYRIGSHRQFVQLARHLARAGHAVLRFDVRGMGDSGGSTRSFEELDDDIAAGIQAMMQVQGVRHVALWGLCDGATASLLYLEARADARVAGLALLNPWVRSAATLARTHIKHYYRGRLLQPAFWRKLLAGGVGLRALRDLVANFRQARHGLRAAPRSFQDRMADAWRAADRPVLVLLSENDWTAKEFEEHLQTSSAWSGARDKAGVHWHQVAGADHTLSTTGGRLHVQDLTLEWLRSLT